MGKEQGKDQSSDTPSSPVLESRVRPDPVAMEERIRVVANHMTAMTWSNDVAANLAETWGVSISTVQNYSAEAHRFLKMAGEFTWLKPVLVERAMRGINSCEQEGDFKNFFAGLKFLADINGDMAPTKSKRELSGPDGGPIQTTRAKVVLLPPLDPSTK